MRVLDFTPDEFRITGFHDVEITLTNVLLATQYEMIVVAFNIRGPGAPVLLRVYVPADSELLGTVLKTVYIITNMNTPQHLVNHATFLQYPLAHPLFSLHGMSQQMMEVNMKLTFSTFSILTLHNL